MRHQLPAARSAFTLLEMVISLGILSTALVALIGVLQNCVGASTQIERQSHIRRNLESRLAEIRSQFLQPGKQTTERDLFGVVYEAEITPLELFNQNEELLHGLYRIKIRAKWKDGKTNQEDECEIIAYQP